MTGQSLTKTMNWKNTLFATDSYMLYIIQIVFVTLF